MLLKVDRFYAGYGKKQAVRDIALQIEEGQVVALIGPNGAGKSTLVKGIFGLLELRGGSVQFAGQDISAWSPGENVRAGLVYIPQGGRVFLDLTVENNLRIAGFVLQRDDLDRRILEMFETFAKLQERRHQKARSLSGGEKQMLGVAMGLMPLPKLLLVDEPSIGLSPILQAQLFAKLQEINQVTKSAMLVVEQNVGRVLEIASYVYALNGGRVRWGGNPKDLSDEDLSRLVLPR